MGKQMREYAEVLIDRVSDAVDRPFHYHIPRALQGSITTGMQVIVPLGKQICQGYVLRLLEETTIDPLRDIIDIVDPEPLLSIEQIALISWLSMRCYCRKIDALNAIIPAPYRKRKRPLDLLAIELVSEVKAVDLSRAPIQQRAVKILNNYGQLSRKELGKLGVNSQTIRSLKNKGLIRYVPAKPEDKRKDERSTISIPHLLTEEQAGCFKTISAAIDDRKARKILLHGITASGKTEIYLQCIAHCLKLGRTALIMVPEIALTPQMIDYFEGRFPERVAVLHSRLTPAEKNKQWTMIVDGEACVVLGARSAVFAPLPNIGLIVVDEEHETTYKQEETPRYHTRDVAWWRVRYHHAVLLLGSATPSLESYYNALNGNMTLLNMTERVTPVQLPPVTVVDMRRELKENNRSIFSRLLLKELNDVLERDEQALLFINRRGFAGFVLCRDCGYVVRCPSCDVSLTLHMDRQLMCCHYCSYQSKPPDSCPDCGGLRIRYFSAGTQRVEEELKKIYPSVAMIRMDSDTTASRMAHSVFYRQFRERKASVLIGTQMVAKGLDFPGITLVGVVAADTALNLPDFRAPERTFQLLTQVSGRTARGPGGGRVIVQTYHPAHYSIQAAAAHDYRAFYEAELETRRQLAYPPFSDLLRFLFSGKEEDQVVAAAKWFAETLQPLLESTELLGPAPAAMYRIKDAYRVQIILKGEKLTRLIPAVRKIIRKYHDHKPPWPVRLAADYNPQVVL